LLPHSDLWGTDYFLDEITGGQEGNFSVKNYFIDQIESSSRYAISSLKDLAHFKSKIKLPATKSKSVYPLVDACPSPTLASSSELKSRLKRIKNVTYSLTLALRNGLYTSFTGSLVISFDTVPNKAYQDLWIDYNGKTIQAYKVNGQSVQNKQVFKG
jgi:hypothetical protein